MNTTHTPLEEKLGYCFDNKTLLDKALTHRSFRYEKNQSNHDNQRLEFLGDAILGLIAAEYLFTQYRLVQEGDLTRMRSAITNSHILAVIARLIDIGPHLKLGHGERASGGADRDSNLTDTLEALLGAIYLDNGMKPVTDLFERFFLPQLHRVLEQPEQNNPKGCLQEFTQTKWQLNPEYILLEETGPAHDRTFVYAVQINNENYGQGTASNKQKAQAIAAMEALNKLKAEGLFLTDNDV